MAEPPIKRFPTEVFGFPYSDLSETAQTTRLNQQCPFLNSECKKPRKSEPHIKVGICSVGFRGSHGQDFIPVIICPHRFELQILHETITQHYLAPAAENETIRWVPEVTIGGTTGSIDYVAVKLNSLSPVVIHDFVCVEIQAAGTTGTPYNAVRDLLKLGHFEKDSYKYGINWANEFAKTMMQQAYKKGRVIEQWQKKLVFAIQDISLTYLENEYDTSGLHAARDDDPIHFCAFKMVWDDSSGHWTQVLDQRVSTDSEGVRRILSGIHEDDIPTQAEFLSRIVKKMRL